VIVELLLNDVFLVNSDKAISFQDINSQLGGSLLGGKISRVKVSGTLENSLKTLALELYFASFIHLGCKASRI